MCLRQVGGGGEGSFLGCCDFTALGVWSWDVGGDSGGLPPWLCSNQYTLFSLVKQVNSLA